MGGSTRCPSCDKCSHSRWSGASTVTAIQRSTSVVAAKCSRWTTAPPCRSRCRARCWCKSTGSSAPPAAAHATRQLYMHHANDIQSACTKLQGTRGRKYWRSQEEVAENAALRESLDREFPQHASEWLRQA